MTDPATSLHAARALRDSLRAGVTRRAERLRHELTLPSLKARAADTASAKAQAALGEAAAIARDSKGIIAASAGALALWLLRRPLIELARRAVRHGQDGVQDDGARAQAEPDS